MVEIAILGAGMAGFGAAHQLHCQGIRPVVYEKHAYCGGNAVSFHVDGFTFDAGPHISFTKDERIQKLFAQSVKQKYEESQARVNNYWKGHWIKHPAQCNLFGLPEDLLVDILYDFIHSHQAEHGNVRNYENWLVATYGKTFAKTFPTQYGIKFHTTTPDNMSTEWVGPRLYKPDIKEVLRGALSPNTSNVHYVTQFRYPSRGGFVAYLDQFVNKTDIRFNHELVSLDPENRTLQFGNGVVSTYDQVISSLPLPDLVPMISGVPVNVVEASQKLACTTCVIVTLGISREDISDFHWTYFYDREFFFTRLSFPHMQSTKNALLGTGSIQAEIFYSNKYRPLDRSPEECIRPVIKDLTRCGILREDDEILFADARVIPYANVIFDLDRVPALSTVHRYLDDIGVFYCGRYGEWGYHWTDESFISGENAAHRILDRI